MAVVWITLLFAAAAIDRPRLRRATGALFVSYFGLACGVQAASFALFGLYFSIDGGMYIESIPWVVLGTLPLRPLVVACFAVAVAAAAGMLLAARRLVPPRPLSRLRTALLLAPALILPFTGKLPVSYARHQSTTPELIYFTGVSWVIGNRIERRFDHDTLLARVQMRHPPAIPPITAAPARPRNVLFLLQEAERADVVCSAPDPACDGANRATNPLLPGRLPLLGMRSNASSTHIAVSSIFTGVDPTESSERLHRAPTIFELAHAAGWDTAYFTNQSPQFASYRLFFQDVPLSHVVWGPQIDHLADWLAGPPDDALTDRVIAAWDELREPFFAVVQYANLHHPRLADPARSPFQPSDQEQCGTEQERNFYKNVVYLSDLAVARLVRHVRESARGSRTVIVYSADHGEALHEHQNENFHSATVHDEELRVPCFVDAPPGTLAPAEREGLVAKRDVPVFQLDLGPTFLDLMGLWDAPAVAPFRANMIGRPLTRPERMEGPVPLTNVSWVWEYWYPNWGLMEWPRKILAGPRDEHYHCFDLEHDPGENEDLGEEACAPLVARAKEIYRVMPPDVEEHLYAQPLWGRR